MSGNQWLRVPLSGHAIFLILDNKSLDQDHGIMKGGESESKHTVNKVKKFEGQLYIDWGRQRNAGWL